MNKKSFEIQIKKDLCKGCGLCVHFCKKRVLRFSSDFNIQGYNFAASDPDVPCTGCMVCVTVCPEVAVEVYYE